MSKALEMTPSDAGLAEAPWPPATANKRGESVLAGEGFEAFCARTKCTFADLMACNFELDIKDPALKGKWQKVVNYYIRTKLGATEQQLTPGGNYKLKGGETLYVPTATQSAKKYLIVYKQFEKVVPESLRESIKKKVVDEFGSLDVELDFSGSRAHHDLLVTFTQEIPIWTVFGESSRMRLGADLDALLSGESKIFVGAMKSMRLQTGDRSCAAAFPQTDASLGSLIANTTIHETAHMLGLDTGGFDDGGHSKDESNYMWSATSVKRRTRVSLFFEYTVKSGDTLSGILDRYKRGMLDPCWVGPTELTVNMVWEHEANKQRGFIAHPTKSGIRGRRANNPNWIYPGEKIAFPGSNLRTQEYRGYFAGFLGKKTFTRQQTDTMKKFIADRLASGKG